MTGSDCFDVGQVHSSLIQECFTASACLGPRRQVAERALSTRDVIPVRVFRRLRFDERGRETERALQSTATAPVLDSTDFCSARGPLDHVRSFSERP
jgi:hypothetical protein